MVFAWKEEESRRFSWVLLFARDVRLRTCWKHVLNRTEHTGSNGTFLWDISLGQAVSLAKKTLPTPVSPVTAGQNTERIYSSLSLIDLVSWVHLFSSHLQACSLKALGSCSLCSICALFPYPWIYPWLFLPQCSITKCVLGILVAPTMEAWGQPFWAPDPLWLGFCASIYLSASGISSNNVFESAAFPLKKSYNLKTNKKNQTTWLKNERRIRIDIFPKKTYRRPTGTWKNVQHHWLLLFLVAKLCLSKLCLSLLQPHRL